MSSTRALDSFSIKTRAKGIKGGEKLTGGMRRRLNLEIAKLGKHLGLSRRTHKRRNGRIPLKGQSKKGFAADCHKPKGKSWASKGLINQEQISKRGAGTGRHGLLYSQYLA